MNLSKVMIVGATSAIAHETAKCFAADGAALFLVGRNTDRLATVADDLKVRGAKRVESYVLDMANLDKHAEMFNAGVTALDGLDGLLVAHGTLGDQKAAEQSVEVTLNELTTNFTSIASILTIAANYFEPQGTGCIAAISSVAGDRGRASNYVYGSAKAAQNAFLSGLRGRLYHAGVAVLTVKPGFVDTPMTAHLKKNPLYANPTSVGTAIYKGMKSGQDVLYTPWFWRYIMFILTHVPEFVFKRMKLKA
jgi:decaprenylphospho-beta-D-erythro-pentofuranosid-2-ulose 2-reductase